MEEHAVYEWFIRWLIIMDINLIFFDFFFLSNGILYSLTMGM